MKSRNDIQIKLPDPAKKYKKTTFRIFQILVFPTVEWQFSVCEKKGLVTL